jgi:hypothetical protein
MVSSPQHSQFSGCNNNLLHLIPELSKHSLDRVHDTESNRNLAREFECAEQDLSKSLREDDLDIPKRHKTSSSGTNEEFKLRKFSLGNEIKEKYESEIQALKLTISKSKENEKILVKRIGKLEYENEVINKKYKDTKDGSNNLKFEFKRNSQESAISAISSDQSKNEKFSHMIQPLMNEIVAFKEKVDIQAKEIDYLRQKENKLMYLFFILHRRGVDVNGVYENELKDVPTDRFNEWVKEHMDDEEPPSLSFDSQGSYSLICEGPMLHPNRPDNVPKLNLVTIPDYITSSDEGEEGNIVNESLFNVKKSIDGSKLNRPSDVNSELSLSFTNNFNSKHFKEHSLNDGIMIDKYKGRKINNHDDPLEEASCNNPVSQSLNTENINFNM